MEEQSLHAIVTKNVIIFLLQEQPVTESEGMATERRAVALATFPFHGSICCIQTKLAFLGLPLSRGTDTKLEHEADVQWF